MNDEKNLKIWKLKNNLIKEWRVEDKFYRENDLPAYENYYIIAPNVYQLKEQRWFVNGEVDRINDQPSEINYYKSGNISEKIWLKTINGFDYYIRKNGPCYIKYYDEEEKVEFMEFLKYDSYENIEDSSISKYIISYFENGGIRFEEWFVSNLDGGYDYHRDDNEPAFIEYYKGNPLDKKIKTMKWYNKGKLIDEVEKSRSDISSKCKNQEEIDLQEVDDENMFMFYDSSNPKIIYCYSKWDLEYLIKSKPYKTDHLIFKNKLYFYRLQTWYVYVEAKSLISALKSGSNTIKLFPMQSKVNETLEEVKTVDKNIYYRAKPVLRNDIFPESNFQSKTSLDNSVNTEIASFIQDVKGNIYTRKEFKKINEVTLQEEDWVEEIKTFKQPIGESKSVLHSLNDNPSYVKMDFKGNIYKEEWHTDGVLKREHEIEYNDFGNGEQKIKEEWKTDGLLDRKDEPAVINYNEELKIIYVAYYKEGVIHRENKAAIITYDDDGNIIQQSWIIDNKQHRANDFPSSISYYISFPGVINPKAKVWTVEGKFYRKNDGPTKEMYYENGNIKQEAWWKVSDDFKSIMLYRESNEMPSRIFYYDTPDHKVKSELFTSTKEETDYCLKIDYYQNGSIEKESWMIVQNNMNLESRFAYHRDNDKPAVTSYYESDNSVKGEIKTIEWFNKGVRHRSIGPALLTFDQDGRIKKMYFIKGVWVPNVEDFYEGDDIYNLELKNGRWARKLIDYEYIEGHNDEFEEKKIEKLDPIIPKISPRVYHQGYENKSDNEDDSDEEINFDEQDISYGMWLDNIDDPYVNNNPYEEDVPGLDNEN